MAIFLCNPKSNDRFCVEPTNCKRHGAFAEGGIGWRTRQLCRDTTICQFASLICLYVVVVVIITPAWKLSKVVTFVVDIVFIIPRALE